MGVVHVGMQQAHGDAVIASFLEFIRQRLGLGAVERNEHLAGGLHALGNHIAPVARQQRVRQFQVKVVLFEAAFGAHLDDIAEPLRGDEGGLCATPLDQRVGGERGAVDDLIDGARGNPGLLAHPVQAFDDGVLRR